MSKPKIIAIVGESGAGKTVLSRHLQDFYNIYNIVSYTTRPIRPGEVNGRDHWFVEDPGVDVRTLKECLAWTDYGGYQYWTETSQVRGGLCTYVIDETGLVELRKNWGDAYEVVAVKVVRPHNPTEKSRRDRDATRKDTWTDWDLVIVNDSDEATFLTKAVNAISNYTGTVGRTIVVDFDGTCVKHRCPRVGSDIGAAPVLRKLTERGHKIVLSTMRDTTMFLDRAAAWFTANSIPLHGINHNSDADAWTSSPKCYGHYYIDDAGLGTPVKYDEEGRRYVDWAAMTDLLKAEGLIEASWKRPIF